MSISRFITKPLARAISKSILEEGSVFSPLSLFAGGQNGLWTSQMDLSTLYLEDAGTTPVTADGDPEGLIQDKSGNGNDGSQSTTSLKPIFRTDGTANWAEYASDLIGHGAISGLGSCTYFIAMRTTQSAAQTFITSGAANDDPFLLVTASGVANTTVSSGYGTVTIRVDGAEQVSPTRDSLFTAICDGQWHVVEVDATTPQEQTLIGGKDLVRFTGDIGEVIIAEGVSESDKAKTRQYIADIYGVAL